ncbi:MAG: response regulator [Myxococcota bacterium]
MMTRSTTRRDTSPEPVDSDGQRLLIVEDETFLRRCLVLYFSARGLDVTEAASLREANARLDERSFDAVVLDIGLPDGSGLSLVPRADAERCVVISADPDPDVLVDCGIRHYFTKPLDLSNVMEAVGSVATFEHSA